ncbi:hypothetical protein Syn7502_00591 [Synechococcus sp. PCC 7502]|uniref:type II toxin-antitoxin system VapB family antitoxin n=1 Tax=Synechococcus sp. PCC 7502 TaxID=1173263 RepID=UPI00029FA393|nr:type II toxin-antitoxin system VapB family antitoxin [Synechococcus sp. PCC 7502]AFY72741.1 hypothetical protein Syn7502_00591 [Synechococcus sp. PCC 7502]
MQITLTLDESLLNEALRLTKLNTELELINLALQELVISRSVDSDSSGHQRNLLDLAGKIQFSPDFNYKILREINHATD